MLQKVSHCHLRGHHVGQVLHHPCVERLLREQDWQASHCSMQGDRPLWLCVGALIPAPGGTGIVSAPVPKKPV
ncbi:rCG31871 [Rattus norvegicus]|uniref:RCG31871 n=1 Tax=Rattus norvegicus TaxID=10116 RepID=A6JN90_RAT|nr:rCG31871 [Rattus norvegicus]